MSISPRIIISLVFMSLTLFGACSPLPIGPSDQTLRDSGDDAVDSYVVLAPRALRAGRQESISVSLLKAGRPVRSTVRVALKKDGASVVEASSVVNGTAAVPLAIPALPEGDYQMQILGNGFSDQATVRVESDTLVFLETDKPIYKPGQTMHVRVVTLDSELKPMAREVTIEAQDAKGIKVYKNSAKTDDFGTLSLDIPLSTEPNLGIWKIAARDGKRTAELDVRVEEYVLPKYEVKIDLPKDWFLASEAIKGAVSAEYSFGKPVKGELELKAARYVGTWQLFANIKKEIDGNATFELPAVDYVVGVPGSKGMGNVSLEAIVRERTTGYEEKTTRLLTIAASAVSVQLIPENSVFKPGLPINLLVVSESPDRKPTDTEVALTVSFLNKKLEQMRREDRRLVTQNGKGMLKIDPPQDAAITLLTAVAGSGASATLTLKAGYSPSGAYLHVEQLSRGPLRVGGTARFKVSTTKEATNLYYEVFGRGKLLFTAAARSPEIELPLTPMMAPSAKLLVYQVLPNGEIAADYLPFTVAGDYPQNVVASFDREEARPGEAVQINLQTQGQAKVGLSVVDRSVFILAENRLNLQQVFEELERLYLKPQAELHSTRLLNSVTTRGAKEVFEDVGVVVMSNQSVPQGETYELPRRQIFEVAPAVGAPDKAALPMQIVEPKAASGAQQPQEIQRIRQFFPETWLWQDVLTSEKGQASINVVTPDSITTWMARAVALSKDHGLGVSETTLKVLQPFFVQVDLPYSAVRNEEFVVKVALYNYTNSSQELSVTLTKADWFDLLDETEKKTTIAPNDVGSATFKIRPKLLGVQKLQVIARSVEASDAVIKELLVEAEGAGRETVDNLLLTPGVKKAIDVALPREAIAGSGRTYVALTGNYLTQTINGLEKLLQMPFGCGEQNMILLAPNVFVSRYLKQTDQLKPEVAVKAEQLMLTGYQRQLTYRRSDGSFSAFGQNDREGSLWLTAFVLKTFAQAKDEIYIDDAVLQGAKAWIAKHQKADGSFDPVGFVTHKEMLGGLSGKNALTAFVAIALMEAGADAASASAVRYLEGQIDSTDDAYTLAISTYALELAKSPAAKAYYDKLMRLAREDENGLHWDVARGIPEPLADSFSERLSPPFNRTTAVETTAYATLALLEHGDKVNGARAAKWLVNNRNAYGGFGSTQDTVIGLQALTRFATDARLDVDMRVVIKGNDWTKEARVDASNADVLQVVEIPAADEITIETTGRGQVIGQIVRRFNVPRVVVGREAAFQISVDYSADQVEVNDTIDVSTTLKFTPPMPIEAGMVVADIAIPTGFAAVEDSLARMMQRTPKIKRFDKAGRKVIVYIEDMAPGEEIKFAFQARALLPVKAQPVVSRAYAYYRPELNGESLGKQITADE